MPKPRLMKILHLNTERTWRGGEQQCLYLLQGLKRHNISSDLVCQPKSPMEDRARRLNIRVLPVSMHGEVDPRAIVQLRRLIVKGEYDIVHSHTSHAHTLAFWACIGISIVRLVTRRVDFSIFRHSFLGLSSIKYRHMADFYIAVSHKIKAVLVGDGIATSRIFVVHSGVDIDRFAASSCDHLVTEFDVRSEERVVLNVAHLAGHKGHRYLLKAIPLVLKEVPSARFLVVGGGQLKSELMDLTNRLNLKNRVVFTGFRNDIGAFYKLADLFVMSSVQEGLGTAVLDAMASGVPVVATRAGGISECVHDGMTGKLVAAGDHYALANAIVYMLKHPNEARCTAELATRMARQHFSVKAMVEKNVGVYHKVLKHHGRVF